MKRNAPFPWNSPGFRIDSSGRLRHKTFRNWILSGAYRDITISFSDAHQLAVEFRHHQLTTVVTFGCGKSLVSVSVQQNHWR
jgi:hypothetical protein